MRILAIAAAVAFLVAAVSSARAAVPDDLVLGQLALQRNCTRCHDLDRVFRVERTVADWERVLLAMSRKEDVGFTPADFNTLKNLHLERQRALYAEEIFARHCDKCHDLERGISAHKASRERWRDAINRMRGKDAQWVSADEAEILTLWHLKEQESERNR